MPRKVSPARARVRADKAQSDYVRQLWADPLTDMATCVSCGVVKHWKEMDCGHFIPKSRANAIRYEETNVHPQCPGCNGFDVEQAMIGYTLWMREHYGEDHIRRLQERARETVRYRVRDYLNIEAEYLARTEELLRLRSLGEHLEPGLPVLPQAMV